jgi:YfiH family protein
VAEPGDRAAAAADVEEATAVAAGLVVRGGVPVLVWQDPSGAVEVAVTSSGGGVSEGPYASLNLGLHVGDDPDRVLENRRRAAAAVGTTLDDLVLAHQVHGARVVVVGDAERGRGARRAADAVADADGLVTADAGPVLVVLVADCVPMVLCDPEAGVLAAVHAGWRGTVAGVGPAAVAVMTGLGAEPGRIWAWLGPAVAPGRYPVGADVARAVRRALGQAAGAVLVPGGGDRFRLDLPGANRHLLAQAGVPVSQVHATPAATGPPGPFFSDRAARPCGRFGLLARLRP